MSRIHLRLALFSSSCFFRFQKRRRRWEKHQQRTFCSTGGRSFFFLPAFSFPLSFVVLTRTGESYFTKDISGGIIVALWFQLLSSSSSSFPFILQTQFQVPARLSKHLHALPLSVSLMRCVRPKKDVRSVGCANKKDNPKGVLRMFQLSLSIGGLTSITQICLGCEGVRYCTKLVLVLKKLQLGGKKKKPGKRNFQLCVVCEFPELGNCPTICIVRQKHNKGIGKQ